MEDEARIQVLSFRYKRSEGRKRSRFGSRIRTLKTADGILELKKPQIMEFPFETKLLKRCSRAIRHSI